VPGAARHVEAVARLQPREPAARAGEALADFRRHRAELCDVHAAQPCAEVPLTAGRQRLGVWKEDPLLGACGVIEGLESSARE